MDDRNVEAIAEAIRAHLDAHPAASDTMEGILRWWIPGGSSTREEVIAAAVDLLLASGTLAVRELPDGSRIYLRADRC